jgi:hypothetical protein
VTERVVDLNPFEFWRDLQLPEILPRRAIPREATTGTAIESGAGRIPIDEPVPPSQLFQCLGMGEAATGGSGLRDQRASLPFQGERSEGLALRFGHVFPFGPGGFPTLLALRRSLDQEGESRMVCRGDYKNQIHHARRRARTAGLVTLLQ